MQLFGLHKSIYKLKEIGRPGENIAADILELRNKVRKWQQLKKHGVPDKEIAEIVGVSRASFYRYKRATRLYGVKGLERKSKRPKRYRQSLVADEVIRLICKIRADNPTYGKAKITVILKRDHNIVISESSVGRIISKLIKTGKIVRSLSSIRSRRKRKFKGYAKRWQYGTGASRPGELVQIDHMTVTKNNVTITFRRGIL